MLVMLSDILCRISTVFADVNFLPPLLVGELVFDSMNFVHVGLETASLGEAFFALATFVRFHASMSPNVSFQIE